MYHKILLNLLYLLNFVLTEHGL